MLLRSCGRGGFQSKPPVEHRKIDGQWYILDVQGDDSSGFEAFFLLSDNSYAASTGLSWDRSAVPACPADYTGTHYHYVFFQRMDQSLFAARMI